MDILFTFTIEDAEKEALVKQFPQCVFHFKRTASCEEARIANVIVTYGGNVTNALLERAEKLSWIMTAAAGVEKMDLEALAKRDILVTNVRGIHKTPMAESILAHILSLQRSVVEIHELQARKDWKHSFNSTELKGSRALILGPGAIGTEVGRLLQAFGVTTIGCNRSGEKADYMNDTIQFNQLVDELPNADFVISILPSTAETKGLLTKEHFEAMKQSAVFLNFGRGDLFDEALLIQALTEGQIRHAVLDVFQVEPLPEESAFWSLENCTVSPHVSSKSGKYIERALTIFKANLEKYIAGETDLANIVDVRRGY